MKTPAQKVIYSLLTLILLLSIGSGVVATNGNRTELINPELDNELSEETLKIIPIEDTLDYALYEQADKLSKSFINQNTKKAIDDNYTVFNACKLRNRFMLVYKINVFVNFI